MATTPARATPAAASPRRPRRDVVARIGLVAYGPVGALLIGAASLVPHKYRLFEWRRVPTSLVLLIIGAAVLVVGGFWSTTYLRSVQERAAGSDRHLERARNAEHAVLAIARKQLEMLSGQLGLYSNGRLSLFLDTTTALVLVGRFSAMPGFDRATGRAHFPYDEGVIGKAWAKGAWEEPGLANPGADVSAPNSRWVQQQCSRYKLPREDVVTMTMKSRSYAAIRLECGDRVVGVLIAEDVRLASATPSSDRTGGFPAVSIGALKTLSAEDLIRQAAELLGRMCDLDLDALKDGLRDQLNRPQP